MGKEENHVSEDTIESNPKNDGEDLLYTHQPEYRGNTMQWNPSLCRRPRH